MSEQHLYTMARTVLRALYQLFLDFGHLNWSVSPTVGADENGFCGTGLTDEQARKALRSLASKGLARHVGLNSFVITEYGIRACDHPAVLDTELPSPRDRVSAPRDDLPLEARLERVDNLEQYMPQELRGRFEAIDHIGGGSFGTVYMVKDRESLQRLALKVPFAAPDARERALREAEAMASLRHPNVMGATEFHRGGEWFLFPLAEGTLGQLHSWHRVDEATALVVAHQVGSALAHAHDAGFVHRDLHVDNILRFDGAWMVADWGLTVARGSERLTRSRSQGGIRTWTAPEQLRSLRDADPRSDLYSLGRIVEWLVTGQPPDPSRAGKLADGHPLDEFVNTLTQLDRDRRPTSASAAVALLPPPSFKFSTSGAGTLRQVSPANASDEAINGLHGRHAQRVYDAARARNPVPLQDGPALILHLFPVNSKPVDLLRLKLSAVELLPPPYTTHGRTRFTHDGLLSHAPDPPPAMRTTHLLHNGSIELVDTYAIQRIHAPEPVLFPLLLERDIICFLSHWTNEIYPYLGVSFPLLACVSLIGIDGFELRMDECPPWSTIPVFDRDALTFPPVVLYGTEDLRSAMKPTFDALWQAAGEDRSLGYSPEGEWLDAAHPPR
jgi:serine/threonine protein kinase